MKRKVLLISPGYYEFGDYGYHDMPPMGLLKIAKYFKINNVDFDYCDFSLPPKVGNTSVNLKFIYKNAPFNRYIKCGNFENEGILKPQKYYGAPLSVIKQKLIDSKPTEIWLSTGLTYYWEAARDIAEMCKSLYPDVPLLVGGIYATLWPQHCNDFLGADYVHKGPLDDIDDLFPDYSVDLNRKYSTIRTLQLGKGCNVNPPCSFCAVVAMDPKFKALSASSLFDYIKSEADNGVSLFRFWASQLLVPPGRLIDLLERIKYSGLKINMVASEGVQPSLFTQKISDLMYGSGFSSVSIPMESINEDQVKDFRKPSDFNDYEVAVRRAQQSGFGLIKSFVMLGIPGQTYDEIIHAIVDCWARDVAPALHQYTPIPGSFDWERFTQFHSKSPEELHPSLWPGANKDMTVSCLEEIKKVAKIGPVNFYKYINTEVAAEKEIWQLYRKWMIKYGILSTGNVYNFKAPLALTGYVSDWMAGIWSTESTLTTDLIKS